jgi:hypothetical protein
VVLTMLALLPLLATVTFDVHDTAIDATVIGSDKPEVAFLQDGKREPVEAREVRAMPVAVAIVLQSDLNLMAGDYWDEDEFAQEHVNLYDPLRDALDHIRLGKRLPAGSTVMLIGYATGAWVMAPWQDASKIDGAAIGSKKDYADKIGIDLVQGIELGLAELAKQPQTARLLLVIGDGNDTNNELALGKFPSIDTKDIEVFAIRVQSPVSSEGQVISNFARVVWAAQPKGIEAAIVMGLDSITNRFVATFDTKLPHDGRPHTLVVSSRDGELARAVLTAAKAPARPRSTWWIYLVALMLVAGALVIRARRGRR